VEDTFNPFKGISKLISNVSQTSENSQCITTEIKDVAATYYDVGKCLIQKREYAEALRVLVSPGVCTK